MKAVVLELRGDRAAVLDKRGRINILKNKEYAVGQVLNIHAQDIQEAQDIQHNAGTNGKHKKTINKISKFKILQLVACLAILLFAGGTAAYAMPCTTVTLDINPSISYSLNVFGKIISVEALNDDGTDIVEEIQNTIQGKSMEEAVSATLDALEENDYIEEEDVPIILTVDSSIASESAMQTKLLYTVSEWNNTQEKSGEESSVKASAITVSAELKEEAEEKEVSPGKLYLVERLEDALEDDSDFDENEWFEKSVKEVEEATAEASSEASQNREDQLNNQSEDQSGSQPDEQSDEQPKGADEDNIEKEENSAPTVDGSTTGTMADPPENFQNGKEEQQNNEGGQGSIGMMPEPANPEQ